MACKFFSSFGSKSKPQPIERSRSTNLLYIHSSSQIINDQTCIGKLESYQPSLFRGIHTED